MRGFHLPMPRGYSLRMVKIGCPNRPFFLIGAMPKKRHLSYKRVENRPDEIIGCVDTLPNERGEHIIACDLERLSYYLGQGAKPSKVLAKYLGLAGIMPHHPKILINAWRSRAGLEIRQWYKSKVFSSKMTLRHNVTVALLIFIIISLTIV